MSVYALLLKSSGLTQSEAADFHSVSIDTIKSWSSGRRNSPAGATIELLGLMTTKQTAIANTLKEIKRLKPQSPPARLPIVPSDDETPLAGLRYGGVQNAALGEVITRGMAQGLIFTFVKAAGDHPAYLEVTRSSNASP